MDSLVSNEVSDLNDNKQATNNDKSEKPTELIIDKQEYM
jgi:hypothetical protein